MREPRAFVNPTARVMLVGMTEVTLTDAQAERALSVCAGIRQYPGMWIAQFDWFTLDAYWSGYLNALSDHAVSDFRTWGLAQLGAPESNTDPIFQLRRQHGLPTDSGGEASFGRERATEIAVLVCDLVEAYIHARREPRP